MRGIIIAVCFCVLLLPLLSAQSIVLVSPSTQGQHSLGCSMDSLHSFEELHYLAEAHYLAEKLCAHTHIEGALGLWRGQTENSGIIDGCPSGRAQQLAALLGRYYHQKAALVFDRGNGKALLITFHSAQTLSVVSDALTRAHVNGATVVPHAHDNLLLLVATDDEQRARAQRLYRVLKGRDLREETGTATLIGDNDRGKAKIIYDELLAHAPADAQQLKQSMYSEHFSDLGLDAGSH